ncbi:MAG: hypothetical protein WCO26_23895 [Deltaproteobacteria bacterium]
MAQHPVPYEKGDLEALGKHCTEEEDAANKVERQVEKSAAAILLEPRIGDRFDAIVTGAGPKGTWVRLLHLPIEGKLVHGSEGTEVSVFPLLKDHLYRVIHLFSIAVVSLGLSVSVLTAPVTHQDQGLQ